MKLKKPPALRNGDAIRVITPSNSSAKFSGSSKDRAVKVLESLGFKVSFSKNFGKLSRHNMAGSIDERVSDFMEAFEDSRIQCVMPLYGGYNANQLLPLLDYKSIRKNVKVFCGFSDITCFNLALLAEGGIVSFSGPAFCSFSGPEVSDFTIQHFVDTVMNGKLDIFSSSEKWAEDAWYKSNSPSREWKPNLGIQVLRKGKASGTLVGGNLSTAILLSGTSFMPKVENSLVFLENYYETRPEVFDRLFHHFLQSGFFSSCNGLILGRPETAAGFSVEDSIADIVVPATENLGIPILSELDFGHTDPLLTIPLGVKAELDTENKKVRLLEKAVLD